MTNLHDFLNSQDRDYQTAISLYHKVKKDNSKDSFFLSVQNAPKGSLHHNLLMEILKNAARIIGSTPQQKETPKPTKPITAKKLPLGKPRFVNNDIVDVKSLPDNLQKLYFENQQLTRELSGLHQQLRLEKSNQARKEIAHKIKSLIKKRQENWKILDQNAKQPTNDKAKKAQHPKLQQYKDELKSKMLSKQQIAYRKRMIEKWESELS